jgi:hypothetical protein
MSRIPQEELDSLMADIEKLCRDSASLRAVKAGDRACLYRDGVFTWNICGLRRWTPEKMKYRLKKLEKAECLISRPCSGGYTAWWPVGLAEKMLKELKGFKEEKDAT